MSTHTFIGEEVEKQQRGEKITGGRTDRRKQRKQLVRSHHVITSGCFVTDGKFSQDKYTHADFLQPRDVILTDMWSVLFYGKQQENSAQ